jgi:hypothetical protein
MDHRARALENVQKALITNRTFPNQVFVSGWDRFRFFDDWHMRQSKFLEIANILLELDGGNCVCLINADGGTNGEIEPSAIYFDRGAGEDAFAPALRGGINWLTCMVILAASSDRGEWCMYCEPMAELGVIAFRTPRAFERSVDILTRLDARTPAMQLAEPPSWVWEHADMNPEFFATLVREYADNTAPPGA